MPGTPWRDTPWTEVEALALAPMRAAWRRMGEARHGLTHFELVLDVYAAEVPVIAAEGFTRPVADLGQAALPTVMRKCVTVGQGG